MIGDLANAVGGYLHDVFVMRLDWWVLLGFVAQAFFTARFAVQWIASERVGKSVIPIAFWWCSIGGGLLSVRLRALSPRPSIHPGPGLRSLRLSAQSAVRAA